MKETLAVIAALFGLTWAGTQNDYALFRYFAPKYEQVRRETFEQSKAYNQGVVQELRNQQFQYEMATPEHKQALASLIRHQTADYSLERLPSDLRAFVLSVRNSQPIELQ